MDPQTFDKMSRDNQCQEELEVSMRHGNTKADTLYFINCTDNPDTCLIPLILVANLGIGSDNFLSNTALGRLYSNFIRTTDLEHSLLSGRNFLRKMSQTQLETIRAKDYFAEQLSNLTVDPSSSPFIYLLPPCLVLLAIDVVVRLSHRPAPAAVFPQDDEGGLQSKSDGKVHRLHHRARKVLGDFTQLEANLSTEMARSQQLCRTLEKRRNFAHHRHCLEVYRNVQVRKGANPLDSASPEQDVPAVPEPDHEPRAKGVSKPFENFCQRLLLQNRIWKQQKRIKTLQRKLEAEKTANGSSAFRAFCDRLLLSNKMWKLQGEVKRLVEEGEQLKRSRVAAVTRAAKQMVLDVRKERLTEEFVKDLLVELDEYKRSVVSLRAVHEKEMAEMAEEWKMDYRRMSREIEHLQLAVDARTLEQELSNQVEDDLRLSGTQRHHGLEPRGELSGHTEDDVSTLSGDSDFDEISNLSSSTIVGSGQYSPNCKYIFDDASISISRVVPDKPSLLRIPRRTTSSASLRTPVNNKTPVRRLDPEPYVGFSFNPLFFGNAITRKDSALKVESPVNTIHLHLTSHSVDGPHLAFSRAMEVKGRQVPQERARAPWRV